MFTTDIIDQWEYLGGYSLPPKENLAHEPSSTSSSESASPIPEEQPFTKEQTCLIHSIAVCNLLPLQKYLRAEDISNEPFPEYVARSERKTRQYIQLLVRALLPENISMKDILNSIETARTKILAKDYTGTHDKLCNALVGWIVFRIHNLSLIRYAALRTPEEFPGERLERYERKDDQRAKNFVLESFPQMLCTPTSTFPFSPKLFNPVPKLKGPVVLHKELCLRERQVGSFIASSSFDFTFLLEEETSEKPSSSTLSEFIEQTVLNKFPQVKSDTPTFISPEKVKKELQYTVIHIGNVNGKLTNLGASVSKEIMEYPFHAALDISTGNEPFEQFFCQNIERVFQESFSHLDPVSKAKDDAIENVITNIPVRLEYEWRTCFPNEKKTGHSFGMWAGIHGSLWTMSGGNCKVIVIYDGKAKLINEKTPFPIHSIGAGNIDGVIPRAKVSRFQMPINKLVTIILANPFLFKKYSPKEFVEDFIARKPLEKKFLPKQTTSKHKFDAYITTFCVTEQKISPFSKKT
jgi:hypothetical protein